MESLAVFRLVFSVEIAAPIGTKKNLATVQVIALRPLWCRFLVVSYRVCVRAFGGYVCTSESKVPTPRT
jgi:hypothetical protein